MPTKIHLVKAVVFPMVKCGCERWTIKKTECWRTIAFKLWCWRRLLRVPWTPRKSNPSILKEMNPEYHLMRRIDSLEKTLMLGEIEGRMRREWQRMGWLDGITGSWWTRVWVSSGSWWWTGKPGVLQSMGSQRVGHDWATELNWTDVGINVNS